MSRSGGLSLTGKSGMSHGHMLQVNEYLVLDLVRERGTTTRPEISSSLGLSAATVSRIVRRLVAADLVREDPGVSQGGRPRAGISFNARSGRVLGIDLGGTNCHGVLADLAGEVLAEDVRPIEDAGDPFTTLIRMIERLERRPDRHTSPLGAVAVGVPAIVDPASGVAIGGPNVHWERFPIVSALEERLRVPFVVDNDVNLAALGHAWRGDARGLSDFVVLSLGTGIGAAVVVDGRLLRGRSSGAGEIGYMILDRTLLRAPRPGDLGAFEMLASGVGIMALATRALEQETRPTTLRDLGHPPSPRDVFAAAADGDPLGEEIVATLVEYVAMAVIATASVVDPQVVVLDGSVGRAMGHLAPRIQGLVEEHLPAPPSVVVSTLGREATAIGALAAALDLSRAPRGTRSRASIVGIAPLGPVVASGPATVAVSP